MQLIRIERAKCAEIERAGCALAHAGGRTVSHSPEQIRIWGGLSVRHVVTKLHLIIFHLVFGSFGFSFFIQRSILQQAPDRKKKEKEIPIPPALLQYHHPKLFSTYHTRAPHQFRFCINPDFTPRAWNWKVLVFWGCFFCCFFFVDPLLQKHCYPAVDVFSRPG